MRTTPPLAGVSDTPTSPAVGGVFPAKILGPSGEVGKGVFQGAGPSWAMGAVAPLLSQVKLAACAAPKPNREGATDATARARTDFFRIERRSSFSRAIFSPPQALNS